MLKNKRLFRLFAAGALGVWCALFMRCATTANSMVRAIMLQNGAQGWEVGFLYQAPEAAADASEAAAGVAFVSARGQTFELALSAAEKALPQTANYRLCDYVLLAPSDGDALGEYEQAVAERQCGRLAARVFKCGFSGADISQAAGEAPALPEKLLQCIKQAAKSAPRLYERSEGLVLPVLALKDGAPQIESEGVLLSAGRSLALTAGQTQAALALSGRGEGYEFWLGAERVRLEKALCSLTLKNGGFLLRVDCLAAPGAAKLSEEQAAELGELLAGTVRLLWANGADVLGLGGALALRGGPKAALTPAKNACPEIRADVKIYGLY